MSCQRRASSASLRSAAVPSSSSSTTSSSSSAPSSPSSAPPPAGKFRRPPQQPCPSALIIFSSCSSASSSSASLPDEEDDDSPEPGASASGRTAATCCLNIPPESPVEHKSSSYPSLAALFRRDEEQPEGGNTAGADQASRPCSASPTLAAQRRSRSHRHRQRGSRQQQQQARHNAKANQNASSSKGRRRTNCCRWPSSIWPSFVSRWRSRIGGAGLHLLALQFCWVLPYLCFANYLERCLLPLRMYCYTQPDLLYARRPVRASTRDCAAHLFANNAASWARRAQQRSPEACTLNRTLPVLLEPWRAMRWGEEKNNNNNSDTSASSSSPAIQRVFVIRSAPRAAEYRKYIRESWKPAVEQLDGPVVFVAGQDGTELATESAQHGDILQLAFEDSYRNLTLKMMGIYRFFTERTPVQQIVVINDDTIVNATALDLLFREQPSLTGADQQRYIIGKVSRAYPRIVFPWLPWYVEADLYPHKCYPPFVQGSSFVISRVAAEEVLRAVCEFPGYAIHLDDILMGLLTNCLGITNFHRDGFDVGHSLDSFTVFHYQFSRYSADTLAGMFDQVKHLL